MIDRKLVYQKYCGHCAYCGLKIEYDRMQVDHLLPQFLADQEPDLDNDRPENLMPSCQKCNSHKGGMRLEEWSTVLTRQVTMLRKNAQFDRALRFGQIDLTPKPIVFYFELHH